MRRLVSRKRVSYVQKQRIGLLLARLFSKRCIDIIPQYDQGSTNKKKHKGRLVIDIAQFDITTEVDWRISAERLLLTNPRNLA